MISSASLNQLEMIAVLPTDVFSELVAATNLSPATDFREADLSEVDFSGSDLSGFDFMRADLRRAKWEGARHLPQDYRFSMRGRGRDPVRSTDFEALVELAKNSKRWSERFGSFTIIIDNFGANYTTLDLTEEIIRGDKGEYMKACSFVYLAAYFLNIEEPMRYCREMANYSNSKINMFKIKKVRRFAAELRQFLRQSEKSEDCPGGISGRQVAGIYSRWDIGL